MAPASYRRKTNVGFKNATQRNAKVTSANKFSSLILEEIHEQPNGNAYPKRDRKLTTRDVESADQSKKEKAYEF